VDGTIVRQPDRNLLAVKGLTGFSQFAIASSSDPLPVELASFEGTTTEEGVTLRWETASEQDNTGFRVQRRGQRGEWAKVGFVEGSGTTSDAHRYRFTDADLPYEASAVNYRLKQVDTDGSATYSETITVERDVNEVQLLGTYPNPVRQQATVRYALPEKQDIELRLYDMLGRQVRTVVSGEQKGRHKQRLDVRGLPNGVYFLRLRANGQVRTQKVTVVR